MQENKCVKNVEKERAPVPTSIAVLVLIYDTFPVTNKQYERSVNVFSSGDIKWKRLNKHRPLMSATMSRNLSRRAYYKSQYRDSTHETMRQ